ncbi:MAG: MerR family transcriptional regulator [Anaeroplasmataceae bacterium]|nr:MerR family transcriptional regulator [Anaeroplasmataceae bacterium]MDE6414810.1 MerR family transcriptional regulator [Anaeroplasmataceae bacterium]
MMQIKDLSKNTGISISAIRYYEQLGLIHPQKAGYYKNYTYVIQEQLLAIRKFQAAGLSLKDLLKIFSLPDREPNQLEKKELDQILDILEETLKKIKQQETLLIESRQMLEKMKKKVNQYYEACE